MGCGPSALQVAELNRAIATDAGGQRLLDKLRSSPGLLSTAASVISSTVGTPLHAACEKRQVLLVHEVLSFLVGSPLPLVREALAPYCRRLGRELPASVEEGLRLAVGMTNCKGQTPLMLACGSGSPQLVQLLLAQGADPWVGDQCGGRAALHYAAMAGHADCVKALMRGLRLQDVAQRGVSYVNVRTQSGLTALHYAVFFDHTAAVEELLRHDPNLNATTTGHSPDLAAPCEPLSTPLHFAAHRGNIELARLLLKRYLLNTPAWGSSRALDPRMRTNLDNLLPWQVAASNHPGKRELSALLHPGEPLERALGLPLGVSREGAVAVGPGRRGPLPLACLAAAALQSKLLGDLAEIKKGAVTSEASAGMAQGQRPVKDISAGSGGEQQQPVPAVSGAPAAAAALVAAVGALRGPAVVVAQRQRSELVAESSTSSSSSSTSSGASRGSGSSNTTTSGSSTSSSSRVARNGGWPRAAGNSSTSSARSEGSVTTTASSAAGSRGTSTAAAAATGPQSRAREDQGGDADQSASDEDGDEDEDEGLCGVCFSTRKEVAAVTCGHAVCAHCAEEMCRGMPAVPGRPRPLACAFCRRNVAGFTRLTAAVNGSR